jgi:hypothetical protein
MKNFALKKHIVYIVTVHSIPIRIVQGYHPKAYISDMSNVLPVYFSF